MGQESVNILKSQGWVQRFTASGSRLQEAIENYRALGYEVRTIPVKELDLHDCSVCLEDENDDTVMIFTKEKVAPRIDGHDAD